MSTRLTEETTQSQLRQSAPSTRPALKSGVNTAPTCDVWGVPFTAVDFEQTVDLIDQKVLSGRPGYFITANLHYVMLSNQRPELDAINNEADFIIADGMPIVWRSKKTDTPIPERVAGSDLIYAISELAARRCYRVFFLGGEPGVAQAAVDILEQKYPGLQVAGVEVPPFRDLAPDEEAAMIERIKATQPDIIFAALGQPKGEAWLNKWHRQLEIPVGVQLGGSFNFVTGNICRSPKWIGRIGMEWAYRFYCEPRRLGPRYFNNGMFLLRALVRDLLGRKHGPKTPQ